MIILSMEKSKSLQKLFTNTGGRNGLGKACCLKTGFSLQSTSVSGAEKYCYHRGALLSGHYALPLGCFRGRYVPLGGACTVHPGRAPRRGPDASRKHHPVPPQAGRRTAHFFTSFPGAGRRRFLPQAFGRAFFFGSPKPFLFGPVQKEMGSGDLTNQNRFSCRLFFSANGNDPLNFFPSRGIFSPSGGYSW